MTPAAALAELLARLGAAPEAAVVLSGIELGQWPAGAVAALKAMAVLRPGAPGSTAVCPGCERACVMPVHRPLHQSVHQPLPSGRRVVSFIVCDRRDDIGRVPLESGHLERWRVDGRTLGDALAVLLGGSECQPGRDGATILRVGAVSGRANKAVVQMRFDGQGQVMLDVAGHTVELGLVLGLAGNRLVLDTRQLARYANTPADGAALATEPAEHRADRLRARRVALKKKGVKAFLQVIAQEEGVSVSMIKKILGREKPSLAAPPHTWPQTLASWPGVSSGKSGKR